MKRLLTKVVFLGAISLLPAITNLVPSLSAREKIETDFYRQQIKLLKNSKISDRKPILELPAFNNKFSPDYPVSHISEDPKVIFDNKKKYKIQDLVHLLLQNNRSIAMAANKVQIAQDHLNQSEAIELLLAQYSSFLTQMPDNGKIQKTLVNPGLYRLRQRIIDLEIRKTSENLRLEKLRQIKNLRQTASEIVMLRKLKYLVSDLEKSYELISDSSKELYVSGEIGFNKVALIRNRRDNLRTLKLDLNAKLDEKCNQLAAMLDIDKFYVWQLLEQPINVHQFSLERLNSHPEALIASFSYQLVASTRELVNRKVLPEYVDDSSLRTVSASSNKSFSQPDFMKKTMQFQSLEFNRSFLKQLDHGVKLSKNNHKDVINRLIAKSKTVSNEIKALKKTIFILGTTSVPDIQQAFNAAKSQYRNAGISTIELVDVEQKLFNTSKLLLQAKNELAQKIYELEFLSGKESGSEKR